MSIFFDFEVGPTGRRFRRAVDGDKYDIKSFWNHDHTKKLFGNVNIGSLIELSTLSICMINENKEVVGFMALDDHPNVPGVDPADWELWIRNMFQKYYLSRNTLFIHFMCCTDNVTEFFLEEALISAFLSDVYLLNIVIMVPPNCPIENIMRYHTFKKRNIFKYFAKRDDDSENDSHYLYVALRQEFCPKLKIRRAVEEDNDDIIEILDKKCAQLKEMYGDYYISEIIGRRPESNRKIIVAELQDRAVGVMCFNTDINYDMLQKTYKLCSYHGLMKATPLEKEQCKRTNVLLKTFGEPIMLGKWGPFDRITKLETTHVDDEVTTNEKSKPRSSRVKVNFIGASDMRRSFEHLYVRQEHSDDYSDKVYMTPSVSQDTVLSRTVAMLDEDPFDYEIVNIDSHLLTVPEALSFDIYPKSAKVEYKPRMRRLSEKPNRIKRRNSIHTSSILDDPEPLFHGEPNAFMIELFGLREDIDDRHGFDLLEVAFEMMKIYDYCIIRVPCFENIFSLLQHFCFVPSKENYCCKYSLYIAHRSSVLGKLRVRKAEFIDVPQIAALLQNLEGNETIWTVENSITNKKQHEAYVFTSGLSLIGVSILEPPEQIDFLRVKYNLDSFHNHKYHYMGHGAEMGFSTLKMVLIYPVFETHFRFFAREIMRLSGNNSLVWLTAYRNKWVAHKANSMALVMIPVIPRKKDMDCTIVRELKKYSDLSKSVMPFSIWYIGKKLTSVSKMNIDTRIVIVGASRTAMAFLNTLLFSDTSSYLTFTSITLVSPHGFPYVRQGSAVVEMMFPKYHTNSDKFMKSVPYTYYVNVVQSTVVDINKQEKYISLTNGSRIYYDLLFLMFGKQYQHPEYLKPILKQEKHVLSSGIALYTRLDVPQPHIDIEELCYCNIPDNVFIVNDRAEANKAITYIKKFAWQCGIFRILVYGESIHAYCCLAALLELNVSPENIVLIDPFPPDNPKKTRVPVFCNSCVDQTIREVLRDLNIKVYSSYYFQSWVVDVNNCVTHIEFISHFQVIKLECSAFFYYGKRGVDANAFIAINKSGMAYDGGILIDHQFRTKDRNIYAAGPITRYNRRYYADAKRQKYYDSYEVGEKLGEHIRNEVDPLFMNNAKSERRISKKSVSFDLTATEPQGSSNCSIAGSINTKISQEPHDKPTISLPDFTKPIVIYCMLPGGLQFLDVRPPGLKILHHYVQSLQYNGIVMETFKSGYFKLHFTPEFVVDGITCLTPERFSLENFKYIYGLSAVVLNNVHLRYTAKKLDNFYDFFRSPWAFFLYHEHLDELFSMVKELPPMGQRNGDTLQDALRTVTENLSNPSFRFNTKLNIRANFETSPHIEAITAYVIEWLSENDVLLPMYFQPWQLIDYSYDVDTNPVFKRRKRNVNKMLSTIA